MVTRKEVEKDVRECFGKLFTEYHVPDEVMNYAVDDVLLCSGIEDECTYSAREVSLACQRAVLLKMGIAV